MRAVQLLACVTLLAVAGWHGWSLLLQQVRFGGRSLILRIGMWWTILPLVVGFALVILGAIPESLRPLNADMPKDLLP